jgi:D-threo-aldose 1-dehydrogenase
MSMLGFGGAAIAGLYAPVTDDEARAAIDAAWEAGIRAFDTAPHYGLGLGERRLGAALAARPRSELVVSTKVGRLLEPVADPASHTGDDGSFYGVPALQRRWDFTADGVRRSLDASLERLGLDRIDVALVHDPDNHEDDATSGALPALLALREAGVVGRIGVGMNQAPMPGRFVERFDLDVVLLAGRWNLLDRSGEALLDRCTERRVEVWIGGALGSGILAGGTTHDYAPAPPGVVAAARRISARCAAHGVDPIAAALQFPLRHPAVATVLVGARSRAEVHAAAAAMRAVVPDLLWAELS